MTDTTPNPSSESGSDFFSNILTPGSSMHPTFLLILDVAFASLLFVLFAMLLLTKGNIHVFALIIIESCLWASVKWFVRELQKVQPDTQAVDEAKANGTKEE